MKNKKVNPLSYEQIMKRVEAAENNKTRWSDYLEDCYDYFLPQRNSFQSEPGQIKEDKVFDSTAVDALSDYASRMESQLVPPGRHWMILEAGSDIPKDQKENIDKQLENMTEIVFNHINSSNFSSQINECFLDLGISTGAIIIEEGDGIQSSLHFRSVPLSDILIERTQKGIVDTVFRRISVPYSDFPTLFPKAYKDLLDGVPREPSSLDKSVVGGPGKGLGLGLGFGPGPDVAKEILDKIKNKPQEEIELIEGVVYKQSFPEETYASVLVYEGKKCVLQYSESDSSPWVVFREQTTQGETYGRGRAMRCLGDAKTLNTVMRYYIETCELLGNPIYTAVDDGIINPNTITIRPKTVIPVGTSDTIQALPISGHPELNIDLIQRLQDSIRRTMLSKPFGQIDETPVRTATEMTIRNADLAQTTMSASGRIQSELLERVIKRCVYILKDNGKLPEFKVNGKEVKIKFTSPSSRQQDAEDLATTLRFMQIIENLPPELIQTTVKIEDIPKYIGNVLGVSKSLIRDDQEQMLVQKKMMEIQQQLQLEENNKG